MKQFADSNTPWYQHTLVVIVLCFLLPPLGFYGLWYNTSLKEGLKLCILSCVFGIHLAIAGSALLLLSQQNEEVTAQQLPHKQERIRIGHFKCAVESYTLKMTRWFVLPASVALTVRLQIKNTGKHTAVFQPATFYVNNNKAEIFEPTVHTRQEYSIKPGMVKEVTLQLEVSEGVHYYLSVDGNSKYIITLF